MLIMPGKYPNQIVNIWILKCINSFYSDFILYIPCCRVLFLTGNKTPFSTQVRVRHLLLNPARMGDDTKQAGVLVTAGSSYGTFTNRTCYMPIFKVKVNDSETIYAVLDTASTNTLCSKRLIGKFGISGNVANFKLCTLNDSRSEKTQSVSLSVTSFEGDSGIHMSGIYVVPNIPVSSASIDVGTFDHLLDLTLADISETDTVDLLIGQDYYEALIPLEVHKGKPGEPFAFRSCLGWCLSGHVSSNQINNDVISHFIMTATVTEPDELECDVNHLWNMENVIELWENECRKDRAHYQLPIPCRDPNERIPNNVKFFVKKLDHDRLHDRYEQEIDKLLENDYAEIVPANDIEFNTGKTWYLLHHAVISSKKPGKICVVFDCASPFHGKSLNERCYQGPDLVNKLLFVLLRFRLCHASRHRGNVQPRHLRFLWVCDNEIVHYRMTTHLFGGVWWAASSTYDLRRTVRDHASVEPLVKDTLERSMYVDDCLKSVANKTDAKTVISGVPEVLKSGGLNLTKFMVNDEGLMSEIDPKRKAAEIIDFSPESHGKVLGIKWNIFADEFYFDVNFDSIPSELTADTEYRLRH